MSLSDIRKQAWETRRSNGAYTRNPGPCADCERMRGWLVRLHVEGVLSEGQAAKATGLNRIDLRKAADDLINSGAVPDTRGQPLRALQAKTGDRTDG